MFRTVVSTAVTGIAGGLYDAGKEGVVTLGENLNVGAHRVYEKLTEKRPLTREELEKLNQARHAQNEEYRKRHEARCEKFLAEKYVIIIKERIKKINQDIINLNKPFIEQPFAWLTKGNKVAVKEMEKTLLESFLDVKTYTELQFRAIKQAKKLPPQLKNNADLRAFLQELSRDRSEALNRLSPKR